MSKFKQPDCPINQCFKAAKLTYNELFGLRTDFAQRYQEGIGKVTAADILRFARAYLPLDRYVLAIVGP